MGFLKNFVTMIITILSLIFYLIALYSLFWIWSRLGDTTSTSFLTGLGFGMAAVLIWVFGSLSAFLLVIAFMLSRAKALRIISALFGVIGLIFTFVISVQLSIHKIVTDRESGVMITDYSSLIYFLVMMGWPFAMLLILAVFKKK
ncbi:MAG: hypothetical protein ACP5GU_01670 [Thermoprotei archaeon]